MTARRLGVAWVLASLVSLAWPGEARAWWEKLEKLSGPGPFWGKVYEFRVVCFGETTPAAEVTRTAKSSMRNARARVGAPEGERWRQSVDDWHTAAVAWAAELGEIYTPPIIDKPTEALAEQERVKAEDFERRGRARLIATSSVGVFWSMCETSKKRRIGIDVSWNTLGTDGRPEYASGAPINLDTLMASVSWRVMADTPYDWVDVGAGGGAYWFTSDGFDGHRGVVLQPLRVTFRAPPAWVGDKRLWRRLAALPGYAAGITMFPAGFEADDFAGVGDRAVRLPRELIFSQYFFLNVEPLLQLLKK